MKIIVAYRSPLLKFQYLSSFMAEKSRFYRNSPMLDRNMNIMDIGARYRMQNIIA